MERPEEKKYTLLSNVLFVYRGVARHKPYLIGLLFLSAICSAGSKFIWLFLSKYMIDQIGSGIRSEDLIRMVCYLMAANILCMIGQNAVNYGKEPAALYVRPMFMLSRNRKQIRLPYEKLECREILDLLEKSRRSTSWTETGIEGIIRFTLVFCSDFFTCLVAVILLCQISVGMIFLVLGFGLLSYCAIDRAAKREKYLTGDSVTLQERKKKYFINMSRDFSYGKDLRLYHGGPMILNTLGELQKELHGRVCMARNQWIKSRFFTNGLAMLREGAMYAGLIYSILEKGMGIGNFTLYVGCVRNFADTFYNVMTVFARLRQCSREVNDFRTLDEYCDSQVMAGREMEESGGYEIRFEHVSFFYPGAESPALRDVSLTIAPGQKLAVVGVNGAGKTTFVKLLLRLYEPTEGAIFINGVNVKEYSLDSYYKLFAPVFQDMECFAFTLAENVSMKTERQTDKDRAVRCLRDAGLGNKLNEWKEGADTQMLKIVREDGILLSGGEKQKMALARALYKDAPAVVLDEPTAALDALAESRMYENFDKMVSGKNAVYISHRLASTRFCDVIALFRDGEIIEYGNHRELMETGGEYARMFQMQAHYYKEV